MIFGNSERLKQLMTQLKLAHAALNNPKIKFAWYPVKLKSVKQFHPDNGKWLWLEYYVSVVDKFKFNYYYDDCDIKSITKIEYRSSLEFPYKSYKAKYDKLSGLDAFELIGTGKIKTRLINDYIRLLERWIYNEQ